MEITLQPGDSAEGFSLLGGEEDDIWLLLGYGVGAVGGLTFFFFFWLGANFLPNFLQTIYIMVLLPPFTSRQQHCTLP